MKNLFRLLIIIVAACVAAACSSPVGAIDGSGGRGRGDDALWVVPSRVIYDTNGNGLFNRSTDLQIFASNKGSVEVVPVNAALISIQENPSDPATKRQINGTYQFTSSGRKVVEVTYSGKTANYSVDVRGTGIGGGDGGGFTDIIWITPP